MAIISNGGTSYPDLYICLSLLALTLISTPLNSLVIRHNLLKKPSLPRNLFLLLAVFDLLACVYIPIDYSVGGLARKDIPGCIRRNLTKEFCEEHYKATFSEAGVVGRVRAAIRFIFTLLPCYLTGLLAITRFLQIKYPLGKIDEKSVFGILILAVLHICLVFVLFFRKGDENNPIVLNMPMLQSSWNLKPSFFGLYTFSSLVLYLIFIFFVALVQLFAVFTSFLTIWELVKVYRKPMTDIARRNSVNGSLKIMITNFGSVANIIVIVIKAYVSAATPQKLKDSEDLGTEVWEESMIALINGPMHWIFWFTFLNTAMVPCFLSTLNPAIYLAFTPDSRKWNRKICRTQNTTVADIVETQNM